MTLVNEKRIKDIMTPVGEYSTVDADCTVKEAVRVLANSFCPDEGGAHQGHRTVIVNDNGKPAGFLTYRALLTAIEPRFVKVDQWAVPIFWEGLFTERCREESKKKVRDIMTPIKLIMLDSEDTIMKAVHAMIKHKLSSLPVAKGGEVVGVVRINEIFQEISDLVADQPAALETLAEAGNALF